MTNSADRAVIPVGALDARVAVVTGASQGIGAAIARALARAGAAVVIVYRRGRDPAEELAAQLNSHGQAAVAVQADVTDAGQLRAAIARAEDRLGAVDTLVCSTSGSSGQAPGPLLHVEPAKLERAVGRQLAALLVPCQVMLPGMIEQGRGSIVAIGSTWSRRPVVNFGVPAVARPP